MFDKFFGNSIVQAAIVANNALADMCLDEDMKEKLMNQCVNALSYDQFLSDETKKEINFVSEEIKEEQPIPEVQPSDVDILTCRLIDTNKTKTHVQYSSPFNWGTQSEFVFPKLKEFGFELLNTEDYENSVRLSTLHNQAILYKDLEFHQVFKMTKTKVDDSETGESYNHILVRIYKVERVGTVKMKQVKFSKLKNLKRSVEELVTIAYARDYNVNVPCPNGYNNWDIVIPYNVVGMLFSGEYCTLEHKYYEDDHLYLDGILPITALKKKQKLRQLFTRMTGREIFPYLNEARTLWQQSKIDVDLCKSCNHSMIEMSTYHD